MKKIHFGCGSNILEGWQNLDLPGTDVRKKLKFENNEVDYIFHEHLLEHLDQVDGIFFLKECFRVLKKGGKMRICCPSIDGFINVYQNWQKMNKEWRQKRHGDNKNFFINDALYSECAFYKGKRFKNGNIVEINNSEIWHKYLWDKDELVRVLIKIGFSSPLMYNKLESEDTNLINLERRGKKIEVENGICFSDFPKELDLVIEVIK